MRDFKALGDVRLGSVSTLLSSHLQALRQALLSLKPTGRLGFEGLIGLALQEIVGTPFSLAVSGTQGGIDGASSLERLGVVFEGKLYADAIPREKIVTKVADFARNVHDADLVWVLGATIEVPSQLVGQLRHDGRRSGISILVLDWIETPLPKLALALAMGGSSVETFLAANVIEPALVTLAAQALSAIRDLPSFPEQAARLESELNATSMGFDMARRSNADRLKLILSDGRRARSNLGQALCPLDASQAILPRVALQLELATAFDSAPDGSVTAILGDEGCGKSWFSVQGWLCVEDKPMLVFIPANALDGAKLASDLERLLVAQLLTQAGDEPDERNRNRWTRRLATWRRQPPPIKPRIVVILDGINQRPDVDWRQIVDAMSLVLQEIGGTLIATSRPSFFQDRVKGRLSVPVREIRVPEWTVAERDEILLHGGIPPKSLRARVAERLRNPRLLGIALRLLNHDAIASVAELDVSRLLFEHIRLSEPSAFGPSSPADFARRLSNDAQTILDRVVERRTEDLRIFDVELPWVADGRFFHEVEGDSGKYEIREDGLTVALGLAVIARLQKAKRNGVDLDAALATLLDPVAALDDTADVILASLTATLSTDIDTEGSVAQALVRGFAGLQNPDQAKYPTFSRLAREKPRPFLGAARELCLAEAISSNLDWLQDALAAAAKGGSSQSVTAILDEAASWLSVHTLSPEIGLRVRHDETSASIQEEREKRRRQISERIDALSGPERDIFGRLKIIEPSHNALARFALHLLAGHPLAGFAHRLFDWCFGQALNSDLGSPYREFLDLVGMNPVDWAETRDALLRQTAFLPIEASSITGKWALIAAMRATGHPDDASLADSLHDELLSERDKFTDWRRIEDYCATDPCDPSSAEPDNLLKTASEFNEVDAGKLAVNAGYSEEDFFLEGAGLGMARFRLSEATEKYRAFADELLRRRGFPLRQGLMWFRSHVSLLTADQGRLLANQEFDAGPNGNLNGLSDQDSWLVRQYHLLLSFPSLSSSEQLDALLRIPPEDLVLLDVYAALKAPDSHEFFQRLLDARVEGDTRKQELLIAVAKQFAFPLDRDELASAISSSSQRLRCQALAYIAEHGDRRSLREIVETWTLPLEETESGFEEWYGSIALLRAVQLGLARPNDVLDRISPRVLGRAARMLGGDAVRAIARRIDASIQRAALLDSDPMVHAVELRVRQQEDNEPHLISIREPERLAIPSLLSRRLGNETMQDFEVTQRLNYEAYLAFKKRLTQAEARIVLDYLALDEFAAIVAADKELAESWWVRLSAQPTERLRSVHNLLVLLAYAFSETHPDRSERLFEIADSGTPIVKNSFGYAGVDLKAMAVWSSRDGGQLDELRFSRLDRAATDREIAGEVMAALLSGRDEALRRYVETRVGTGEPAKMSRALMVVGFANPSEAGEALLSHFEAMRGRLGDAAKAARYAYQRNLWSRHWYERMCQRDDPAEYWQAKLLLNKIVDRRFESWCDAFPRTGTAISHFRTASDNDLKRRYERWDQHRSKKLCGRDAPSPTLLNALLNPARS